MAAARSLLSKLPTLAPRAAVLPRLRPLAAAGGAAWRCPVLGAGAVEVRAFSTRPTTSSLNDPQPNWSNRPPKETILLDGCDFEHWLVVVDPPEPNLTREEIIDIYIKKLAEVLGSEEEARSKIYSVSTKHYFAFGALVSEELSYKIKALEKVRWVLPDSYLDVRNKDYGGEPFIDGQAVPYDPKYHEEWVRNNARANERNRRNDRPRNNDRSRNFERRRENMQQNFQNPAPPRDGPPMPNNAPPNPMPPRNGPPVQSGNPQTGPTNFTANNAGPPRGGYPNQMPNTQNNYAPSGPPPPAYNQGAPSGPPPPSYNQGAPSGPPPPAYNQGYQGGSPAGPVSQGYNQGYQGNPQGYNGGGPNYQQGRAPAPNYQQGGYPQQGANPGYNQTYNAGGQGGGEGPNYYQQPGQGGAPYQGNMPGRD